MAWRRRHRFRWTTAGTTRTPTRIRDSIQSGPFQDHALHSEWTFSWPGLVKYPFSRKNFFSPWLQRGKNTFYLRENGKHIFAAGSALGKHIFSPWLQDRFRAEITRKCIAAPVQADGYDCERALVAALHNPKVYPPPPPFFEVRRNNAQEWGKEGGD